MSFRADYSIVAACLLLTGCAATDPHVALPAVQTQLGDHAGLTANWPVTDDEQTKSDQSVRALLAHDLAVDDAVRLALLNNRGLRASFEELGLSQADLAAAGRLPNPTFFASLRWPNDRPHGPNAEFSLTASLLDSVLLPLRKRVAADQLVQVQRRIVHEVLSLVADVKMAAYGVLAQQELQKRLATINEVNEAAADLANRQYEAGNISRLDLAQSQAAAQQSQLDVMRAEFELKIARERLSRFIGLIGSDVRWTLSGDLPALPANDGALDQLESLALAQRLDFAAVRAQVALAETALRLK